MSCCCGLIVVFHVKGSGGYFTLVILIGKLSSMKQKAHGLGNTSSLSTVKYGQTEEKSEYFPKLLKSREALQLYKSPGSVLGYVSKDKSWWLIKCVIIADLEQHKCMNWLWEFITVALKKLQLSLVSADTDIPPFARFG